MRLTWAAWRGYWWLLVAGVSGAAAAADVSAGGADGIWDAAVAAGVATANELLETQPDPFVKAQQLARSELVLQYEVVRRPVRTAASRAAEYRGVTLPGKPTLVFDRREAGVAAPMLGNRNGKDLALRYYTAATLTALPEAGQGLAVKNKAEVHLPDYSKLGAEDAPYLLVV